MTLSHTKKFQSFNYSFLSHGNPETFTYIPCYMGLSRCDIYLENGLFSRLVTGVIFPCCFKWCYKIITRMLAKLVNGNHRHTLYPSMNGGFHSWIHYTLRLLSKNPTAENLIIEFWDV